MKKKSQIMGLTVLTLCYLACYRLCGWLDQTTTGEFNFKGIYVSVTSVCGIISVIQIALVVLLLCVNYRVGFVLATILQSIMLGNLLMVMILQKNFNNAPGICMAIGGILIMIFLYRQFKVIENSRNQYKELSYTDSLTLLPNRRGMMKYMEGKIAEGCSFYLLFMDLDNFKSINDCMGHKFGDKVLYEAGRRWKTLMDGQGFLARNSGDEFVMLIPNKNEKQIIKYMQQCLSVLSEVFIIDDYNYYATASIGAAKFPDDTKNLDELFQFADTAMYSAKKQGKNSACVFTTDMYTQLQEDQYIENMLKKALMNNDFYLVFQPQFYCNEKILRGFEALLRLKYESTGCIGPSQFIPIAERSGLIRKIDQWVLLNAMLLMKPLLGQNKEGFILSVNISAKQLNDKEFANELVKILMKTRFPAHCLELEITEYCFVNDEENAMETLRRIKKLGVKIALDDFGTGYASLINLTKMPLDILKIDKSFINNMTVNHQGSEFVKAVIEIAHMFQFEVISEGVEEEMQLSMLTSMNCDYIQGYIWGRPMELSDVHKLISLQKKENIP